MERLIIYMLLPSVFVGTAVFGTMVAGRVFITKLVETMSQRKERKDV